ncbi:putative chalcone-flavanone isomerase [Rosellinia necatrix]|uniref:Putative chalcone-flavanone isomerase n=1 Tax=Rosellinia necatrix TaxID=77044 RepID=A0A1W2THF9_ROSNE|nr:putative chalcone-flavanone isomerase [Rosellinia necatrix]
MRAVQSSLPSASLLRSLTPGPRLSTAPSRLRCLQMNPSPVQRRTFLRNQPSSSGRAYENVNIRRMKSDSYNHYMGRYTFLLCGAISSAIATCYTAYLIYAELHKPTKLDSGLPSNISPFTTEAGSKRKTVVHDAEGREIVPTGNSVIPTFPRLLDLAFGAEGGQEKASGVEYTLVGLGVRTVTFIGIQVYMVGYYIATQDVAAMQARLVKEINPIATTLIASEKDALRRVLLDPVESERIWNSILQEVRPRSVFRIVPVRDTDFHHLRDGLVRAITARSQGNNAQFGDETFGQAMKDFKTLFNRGKVPKSRELLLCRDAVGRLTVTYNDGQTGMGTIGRVVDERISRLLWLNYLAGKQVASEPARQSIVDGIMEFVERPIGTVATRVI